MAFNVTVNELLHRYFFKDFNCKFHLETLWKAIFKKTFPEHLNWLLLSKAATGSCSGNKKVLWDVFFSEKLRCSGYSVESARTLAKLWIYFLHQNTWIPWKKKLISAKLAWKRDLPKNTAQQLLLCIIIKVVYPDMERIWIK